MKKKKRLKVMIHYRKRAQRWRVETHECNCRWSVLSTPALNSLGKGYYFCSGAIFFRTVGLSKGRRDAAPCPPRPSLHGSAAHLQLNLPAILGGGGVLTFCSHLIYPLPQVWSLSHLTCPIPSAFPLRHLQKNNFQTLLVTKRDAETGRRES